MKQKKKNSVGQFFNSQPSCTCNYLTDGGPFRRKSRVATKKATDCKEKEDAAGQSLNIGPALASENTIGGLLGVGAGTLEA